MALSVSLVLAIAVRSMPLCLFYGWLPARIGFLSVLWLGAKRFKLQYANASVAKITLHCFPKNIALVTDQVKKASHSRPSSLGKPNHLNAIPVERGSMVRFRARAASCFVLRRQGRLSCWGRFLFFWYSQYRIDPSKVVRVQQYWLIYVQFNKDILCLSFR